MGQVSVSSTVLIDAEPETVLPAVADYQAVRPKMLSPHYSGYRVLEGGRGAGTVRRGSCRATKSRVRDVEANPLGRSALAIAGALVDAWNRPLPRGKWKIGTPCGSRSRGSCWISR